MEFKSLVDEQFLDASLYSSRQLSRWLRRQRHGMGSEWRG
jgi:hypothetical protein